MTPTALHAPHASSAAPASSANDPGAARLREALKRCSPATVEAACQFRRTGDLALLPAIVRGVIEHYVDRDARTRLHERGGEVRLSEDLGIDSLTLMEIVMLAEDALPLSIPNEDLRRLGTLAELERFIADQLRGAAAAPAAMPPFAASASAG